MKNIIGIILCGGESKRMGTDKGLMPIHNTIRAKFVGDKLSVFKFPVVYSINENQVDRYKLHISIDDLLADDDALKGPASGLLTAHNKFPAQDFLLLACDMLDMDTDTIKNLMVIYDQENDHDFYVYQDASYAQPFCGIYTSHGLSKLKTLIHSQSLTNLSMQTILNNGDTKRLVIKNKKAFENYNFKT